MDYYKEALKNLKPTEVVFIQTDWKDSLDKEEMQFMMNVVKKTDGTFNELQVTTADANVFAAGPQSFFDWFAESDLECAFDDFMCLEIFDEDSDETIDEVEKFFMDGDQLMVESKLNGTITYESYIEKMIAYYKEH